MYDDEMSLTPTNAVVREIYSQERHPAEFDRWLDKHDREVAAETLESIANNDEMGAAFLSAPQSLAMRRRAERLRASDDAALGGA